MEEEEVVLLADGGAPIGAAPKAAVHTTDTPLHLAFSCYLLDGRGRLLLTRRALTKVTWPGVWTNSLCGHPAPGESFPEAIARRAREELGCEILGVRPVLPDFRYRAVDVTGIVENEICPVFTARLVGELDPRTSEVCDHAWLHPGDVARLVAVAPFLVSPWMALQVPHLLESVEAASGRRA